MKVIGKQEETDGQLSLFTGRCAKAPPLEVLDHRDP